MEPSNVLLLFSYKEGFYVELHNLQMEPPFKHSLLVKAFNLGKSDALLGDDNTSLDYQSDEQILKRIKE
jgi:hypothetical protein